MVPDSRPLFAIVTLTCLGLFIALLDTFLPKKRTSFLGWLAAAGSLAALAMDWTASNSSPWNGILLFDSFSRSFNAIFLVSLAVVCIASAGQEGRMRFAGEYYALLIFSTIGLMLMASAGGLIALYLGLELSTI